MSELDIKFPGVEYDKADQDKYSDLILQPWSPFHGKTRAQVFIFAMAYAYSKKMTPKPLPPQKSRLSLPPQAFEPEMRSLIRSLAISSKNQVQIIMNNQNVLKICEEYANAAIGEIYNKIKNKDSDTTGEQILEDLIRTSEGKRQTAS